MPELYQPADKASVAKRRAIVIGILIVGLATLLGANLGGRAIARFRPTKADVVNAARSLTPPRYQVTSQQRDTYKDSGIGFAPPTYAVRIDVEGGGATEDRRADFQRQAAAEGWRVTEETGVATFLLFERGGIVATVSVGGEGGLSSIEAFRRAEPSQWPLVIYPGIGALVGSAIAVGVILALRRRW